MHPNQNWDRTDLRDYLLFDKWEEQQAWYVLAGLDYHQKYKHYIPLDIGIEFDRSTNDHLKVIAAMTRKVDRLKGFWENSIHVRVSASPSHYINWALSKQFHPPWLDWAIEHKLYVPEQEMKTNKLDAADTEKTYTFNQKSTTYPIELDLACQAWRAVSSTNSKGKPKARIEKWLKDNTKLSDSAMERISIVANWEKTGGATTTK